MLLKPLLVSLVLLAFTHNVASYKILVYCPQFGQSHIFFMGGIADQLAEAGHNVTYLQTELVHATTNTGAKTANVIVRKADFEKDSLLGQGDAWKGEFTLSDIFKQFMEFGRLLSMSCYHLLKDTELMDRLQNEHFDIGIGEHYDGCTYAIFHRLGIKKYISAFAVPIYASALNQLGLPLTTSFVPSLSSKSTPNMTYLERATHFIGSHIKNEMSKYAFGYQMEDAIQRALGYRFIPSDHAYKSSYYFVNTDEHLDYVQPTTQKIVYIGGLRLKEPKPLPTEFEQIATESVRGIVVISFGTVALSSRMPNQTKSEFITFISNFPDITFVWKYETPEDGYIPSLSNLILSPWLPQSDLLAHPKTLAFITHAGMNSISEGARRGVPMLCVPLFGDQQRNAQMANFRGIARVVKRNELTSHTLTRELLQLLSENEPYRKTSKHLAAMIEAKPFKASQRVVQFTEHAVQFDVAANLDMYSRHLSTIEYYGIDVYAPLIALLSLIVCSLYLTTKWLVRFSMRLIRVSAKSKVE